MVKLTNSGSAAPTLVYKKASPAPLSPKNRPTAYIIDPYYDSKEWRELRRAVCERDDDTCRYCGSEGYQADHVVPRKKGGADTLANLVCACATCNRLGGGRAFGSFDTKRRYILDEREASGIKPTPPPMIFFKDRQRQKRNPVPKSLTTVIAPPPPSGTSRFLKRLRRRAEREPVV